MLLAAISSAAAEIDGDTLTLDVPTAQLPFLESERDTLAANALKAFGRKLKVVVKAGGDEPEESAPTKPRASRPAPVASEPSRPTAATAPPAAPALKGPAKAALKSKAMADPGVARTLDLFGGTLLDVKPLDTPEPTSEDGAE